MDVMHLNSTSVRLCMAADKPVALLAYAHLNTMNSCDFITTACKVLAVVLYTDHSTPE